MIYQFFRKAHFPGFWALPHLGANKWHILVSQVAMIDCCSDWFDRSFVDSGSGGGGSSASGRRRSKRLVSGSLLNVPLHVCGPV
jgi:hypothetical protein